MDDSVDADDWLLQSLQMYSDLHVYELQEPTRVIEWTSDASICVAGYSASKINEILELTLPPKLTSKGNQQGICTERDFKVAHGGFSENPVCCLQHICGTRCLVTSGHPGSPLQIWKMGDDDSDTMKRTGCLELNKSEKTCKLASGVTATPCVLHGSEIRNVSVTDVTTETTLYTVGHASTDTVSSVQFVDDHAFLICTTNGDLWTGDIRDSSAPKYSPCVEDRGAFWCMDVKRSASLTVARLSSDSEIVVADMRDLRATLCHVQLNIQSESSSQEFLKVAWAPALDNCLTVSGFNGLVRVYDTTHWKMGETEAQPWFTHRGHMMEAESSSVVVTSHMWHPWRTKTVLSAATDGSLHVWDWVDKKTTSF